jgi:hypothetical protein
MEKKRVEIRNNVIVDNVQHTGISKGQVQTLMEDGNDRMVLNSVQAIACPLQNSSAPFCQKQIVFLHYHLVQVLNHFKFLKHMTSAQGQSKYNKKHETVDEDFKDLQLKTFTMVVSSI